MKEKLEQTYLPVIALDQSVLFPGTKVLISLKKENGVTLVEKAKETDGYILALAKKTNAPGKKLNPEELYQTGTLAHIDNLAHLMGKGYALEVTGESRVKVLDFREGENFLEATSIIAIDEIDVNDETLNAFHKNIQELALEILDLLESEPDFRKKVETIEDPIELIHTCAQNLPLSKEEKQDLIEIDSIKIKGLKILGLLVERKEGLELQSEMAEKLTRKVGKAHRESILREQLRAIQEELEEDEPSEAEKYEKKIIEADMPEEVNKIACEELKRLLNIPSSSPEHHVIRTYLDTLLALPWNIKDEEEIDLDKAREILERDHYGLKKIKSRIIQHLAVMKLKKERKGSILLLVGPPGVGKTSLGKSIAEALGRKFVRISLGGVRDDSEVRGHRRTYIGSMPGRIIQGIKRSGAKNPVFVLDEIDKLSRGFTGDPASALLEVLDPEQNDNFLDHYLDVAYDLSHVFFIATANSLDGIPGPLRDRLEIIEVSGYTEEEKLNISEKYLVPKQLKEHGISEKQLLIHKDAQQEIIERYSREAGVRELQRNLATICRVSSEKILDEETPLPVEARQKDLEDILGPTKFDHQMAEVSSFPGVVTGLAWTSLGGEILFVEAGLMPGKGDLILTGQLGNVMKESAQIALSLVRSKIPMVSPDFQFDKHDIHVHVPSGAIPKDGPSAGITMLTAIASLVLNRPVNPKIGMTGEITLRGVVMPVGGIKEKILAAHRAGIQKILLCKKNEKDLREIPKKVRSEMQFEFVETASDVLKIALNTNSIEDLPYTTFHHQNLAKTKILPSI